ncbi:MAG TPA: CHRD domain-containing protein, partial [Geminicoccaceae bacterium]|nr:CHRD domain-containing protein [Geminicoccaceae bacterium]
PAGAGKAARSGVAWPRGTLLPAPLQSLKAQRIKEVDMSRGLFTLLGLGAVLGIAHGAVAQDVGGRPLAAFLSGAEEVPGPGDPDGSGEAFLTFNPGRGQICYQLTASDIAPATAAHIHIGAAGIAGPVVVPLVPPTGGSSSDCAPADRDLIRAIMRNFEGYYVNVHNADFPAGAIRGQLEKQ